MRRRSLLAASFVLFLGLTLGLALSPVIGQIFEDETSPERRAALYEQLTRDVAHLEEQGNVLKNVVKLIRPTVVHIDAEKPDPGAQRFGGADFAEEAGSGVIVAINGGNYVLTNWHVLKGSPRERIHVGLADGRRVNPTRVWNDAPTDIAVLELDEDRLIPAKLGDSGRLEIGDFVLAVGSPFGLSHSITFGIVSAKGRRDLELGDAEVRFQDFIQTDAAINPGNSGGPLVNLRAEVVGINTAIASASGGNEGIGFTTPINMAMKIARQLIEHGEVERAFLGVNLDSRFGSADAERLGLPRLQGARIVGITPGSPAEEADLRVGDVVLQFDGRRIEDDAHLVNIVSLTEVDKEVKLVIWRNGRTERLTVKVGNRATFERRRR